MPKQKNVYMLLVSCARDEVSNIENNQTKTWLINVLEDMTESPVQRMKRCIAVLMGSVDGEDDTKMVHALQELQEWCEHIDFAIDFHKIGGFEIFTPLLRNSSAELCWRALELIALLVQNNPYCQKAVLEGGYLPTLLQILDESDNATVKTKALFAVSCLCTDYTEALKIFMDNRGFSSIMRAMQGNTEKLKTKAAFFISKMCRDEPAIKDTLCDMGMVEQLIGHLNEEHSLFQEHAINALLMIAINHEWAIQECRRPELNLLDILRERINSLKNKEEFQEECCYAKQLLDMMDQTQETQCAGR